MITTTQPINCIIRQTSLRALLDRARGAVGRMHPYFRLDIYLTRLTACANDMRVGIISEINKRDDDDIKIGGTVCMPAGKMWDIISALPDKPVRMSGLVNNRLQIDCGTYSGVIACVDHEAHFPDMIVPGGSPDFECDGMFLNDIHAACGHSLGTDDSDIKSGLHIRAENGNLVGVALDGHRLSLAACAIPYDDDCEPINAGVTISGRALNEIKKLGIGSVEVRIRDNRLSIEKHHITIISRLLDGTYPAYRRVIPTDHPNCLVVNTRGLIEIIARVTILSESAGITLAAQGKELTVSGENSAGTVLDTIDCEIEGEPLEIVLTPRYLLESLKSLTGSEDIVIKYRDALHSLVLIPADHSAWNERLELITPRRA